MNTKIIHVKEHRAQRSFMHHVSSTAKAKAKGAHVSLSSLRYSTRLHESYVDIHFTKQHEQLLQDIVDAVLVVVPTIGRGEVSSLLSEVVNSTVLDAIKEAGRSPHHTLTESEQQHLNEPLIALFDDQRYIARHPWMYPLTSIESQSWTARDVSTGAHHTVEMELQDNFVHYTFK